MDAREAGQSIFLWRCEERFLEDLLRLRAFAGLLQLVVSVTAVNSRSTSAPIYVLKFPVKKCWTQIWLFLSPG